jgi:hypothetical protein
MLLVQKNSVPTATANELARLTGGACGGGTPPPVPACSTVADILVQMNGPYGPDCPPITNLAGQAIKRLSSSDEYTFSDGTGLVRIDINTSSASNDVPLNTPIVITDGDVESREIRVSGWVLAP